MMLSSQPPSSEGADGTNSSDSAPDKQDKDEQLIANDDSGNGTKSNDNEDMEIDTQQGSSIDNTKHKKSFKGTPIKPSSFVKMGSGTGHDNKAIGGFHNPPIPFSQFAGSISASPQQSPVTLQQEDNECVSLPTVRKGNVFQEMMIAKHTRNKGKKSKNGAKGRPVFLNKPIPGITKIKRPISDVVSASKLSAFTNSSPKRDRDTMEGKTLTAT
jgi:hypothetical protein